MLASRRCWAYMRVHTDTSTLVHVLHVLNSGHITYRVRYRVLIAAALFARDAEQLAAFPMWDNWLPLSPRLLDSALGVWIWRRAGAGGTMPCSCPRLHITAPSWIENSAHCTRQQGSFNPTGQPRLSGLGSVILCICVYTFRGNTLHFSTTRVVKMMETVMAILLRRQISCSLYH